ncbi:MAG TPA: sulfatase-like hydrolase/transferase [Puia sp.]|jgi:phosphoglycerol transferase MdoB-like AlkP superfamily enzyme|nr:sulfatase-like hydrolase/transferase [Puia sp.]
MVFLICNSRLFLIHGVPELLRIFWWGMRMDLSAIALLNVPAFLLFFLGQYRLAWGLFLVLNAAGMALNILDTGYYRFSRHRSNIDLWYVLGDSAGSFGSVVRLYFPLLLFFAASVFFLVRLANRVFLRGPQKAKFRILLPGQLILLLLLLLAIRGWQARPMLPATPLLELDPGVLPLAQNSVSTLAYSIAGRGRQVTTKRYFDPQELERIAPTNHRLGSTTVPGGAMQKKNVVVFILESFSRCYVMPGDPWKAQTPFLDSLIRKSLFFPHSFANGFTSNQGIVAILGGLPAFTDEPFFYSPYANTPLHSLGNILKGAGYNTNFLMGAPRDHFGFGKLAHMAGIEYSYWQPDFNDNRYYDGNWGIFDGPFLQYGAQVLSAKPQPFMAVFFTISAHPPFTIPPELRQRFALPGQTPAQRSISYTDFALREFFAASMDKPWFRNTLFVFCADHWLDPDDGKLGNSGLNNCTIPIFIYDPGAGGGEERTTVAGQVDIAPTVLDLLGYKGSYSGFGHSLLDTAMADSDRYVVNKVGATYQIISSEYLLGYDPVEDKSRFLYHYAVDSALTKNVLDEGGELSVRRRLEKLIRANIQSYGEALTRRSLE